MARTRSAVAERAIDRSRRRMDDASVDAYVGGSEADELVAGVGSVLDADSFMDLERADVMRDAQRAARDRERHRLDDELDAAQTARDVAEAALADHDARLLAARRAVVDAGVALEAARARVAELDAAEVEWLRAASRTAASPIMGPIALDVDDLVRKVRSANVQVRLTVPLEELAALFLEEGRAEGVRGDVAFAQSILETGSFTNPASGSIVVYTDNNFAGIGACDSCEHGRRFATARDGVRAQIQALRTYADPTVDSPDDYASPMVLPQQLDWIRAGRTKTWYELTGKWATGAHYGLHVFSVYRDMYAMRTEAPAEVAVAAVPTSTVNPVAWLVAVARVERVTRVGDGGAG
jgi:hypothetical protein